MRPLAGYRLPSSGTVAQRTALIVFGVVGRHAGRYAIAGVNIEVRENGSTVTVQAIGPLAICVSANQHGPPCPDSFTDRALKASKAYVGG